MEKGFAVSLLTIAAVLVLGAYVKRKSVVQSRVLLLMPLVVLSLPFIALLTLICIVYRRILSVVLSIKHGSKFGGLVEGCDGAFVFNEVLRNPSCGLYIIRYDRRNPRNFYDTAREVIYNETFKLRHVPKIFGSLQKCMGYSYLLNGELEFDDLVKPMKRVDCLDEEMGEADLMRLVSELSCVPFPRGGKGLWEFHIGTQPVKWTRGVQTEDTVFYPVFQRVQHVVIDGSGWLRYFGKTFGEGGSVKKVPGDIASEKAVDSKVLLKPKPDLSRNMFSSIRRTLVYNVSVTYTFVLCLTMLLVQNICLGKDRNALHGPPLTDKKFYCVVPESSPYYVETVKRIRRKIPGCTFLDVLLTGVSASLAGYFEKRSMRVPHITLAVPEDAGSSYQDISSDMMFRNTLTFSLRKLPVTIKEIEDQSSLVTRLHLVINERHLRGPYVTQMNAWLFKTFYGFFPEPLAQFLTNRVNYTLIISSAPFGTDITFSGGCRPQNLYIFPSHRERTGLTMMSITTRSGLQLAFAVDRALISGREEAQGLLEDVYKNLSLLEAEIGSSKGNKPALE